MDDHEIVVTEQRGKRFIAPGFVALICAFAVARVAFGGSRNTATIVVTVMISVVGLAFLGFCVHLAVAGRSHIVVTREDIRWDGSASGKPPHIDRSHGDELILHITPTAFSREGGRQHTWELVTVDGAQRIDLMHFDPQAVGEAARSAGWVVTDGKLGRIPPT